MSERSRSVIEAIRISVGSGENRRMMETQLNTTDVVRTQTGRTLATCRLMMQGYRKSYWKTVLAAGLATLACMLLAIVWVAMGEILAPALTMTRQHEPVAFWALVTVMSCCAMAGAAVVSGGVICLYREWKQYR